jgi:hypothetical protein
MYLCLLSVGIIIGSVAAEGYYCPYTDLGASVENNLLYDYYTGDLSQGYWERIGEVGWQSIGEYCRLKGDSSVHSDAGEWKCNDSRMMCIWDGSNCNVNAARLPDCKELCQAVIDNKGPDCLGNCPEGSMSNTLYDICQPRINNTTENTLSITTMPTRTNTIQPTTTTRPRGCVRARKMKYASN